MDAVGVADEVVIEAIVALLPREFPQGYIGHTWNGNDRNPPGFGWNYTRQVCLLDVDSLGRVVMEALGEGETFNKRFKKIVGSTWSEEREAGPSDSVAASPEHKSGFNLQQNL